MSAVACIECPRSRRRPCVVAERCALHASRAGLLLPRPEAVSVPVKRPYTRRAPQAIPTPEAVRRGGLTYQEIADRLGLSRARVQQIEALALRKLGRRAAQLGMRVEDVQEFFAARGGA
jgi:hypothetical protein